MSKKKRSILILVCGGTASGKTTVANQIKGVLPKNLKTTLICLDAFYKASLSEIKENRTHTNVNFDHPTSFDWKLAESTIKRLLNWETVTIPVYNYVTSKRSNVTKTIKPTDVIIVEGIYALYSHELNKMAALKIFVDTPDDERFIRRLLRDKKERGRTDLDIVAQWRTVVQPMFKQFVEPQRVNAHLIIPWRTKNDVAINALKGATIEITKKTK